MTDLRQQIVEILKENLPLGEETIADSIWYGTDLYEQATDSLLPLLQAMGNRKETVEWNYLPPIGYMPDRFRPINIVLHSDHSEVHTITSYTREMFGEFHHSEVWCWSYVITPPPPTQ